jgi:hypothetical protein
MARKSAQVAFFLLVLAFGLSGCVRPVLAPFGGSKPPVDGESFAEFLDVPYPSNMGLDRSLTFTYERRGVLSGTIVVAGRLTMDEAAAYFDLHLPGHGWVPVAEAQGQKIVSTWRKGQKYLTIIVSPAFAIAGQDSRIEIWVAPPRSESDLGKRVIYKKPAESKERSTTPIRGRGGDIREEDL